MKLITAAQYRQMLQNGGQEAADPAFDPRPVVKLFTPDGAATWLLCSLDPEDDDIAFGLCDLGVGHPELGTVRLSELSAVRGRIGLAVERDQHWSPGTEPINAYARAAMDERRLVDRL